MTIKNSLGLSIDFVENGSVKCIEVDPIRISLRPTTPFSRPGTNIYLRKRTKPYDFIALTGPESNSLFCFEGNTYLAKGSWAGLDYLCSLKLSEKSLSWQWSVEVTNGTDQDFELDLIYLQDVGLKTKAEGLTNEYYVSQYLERLILDDKNYGSVICCRQNMKESNGFPWLMMACRNGGLSASTDGMQFYGAAFRETGIPSALLDEKLGGDYAGESSVLALQQKPFNLAKGEKFLSIFIATFLPNHPNATSTEDLTLLPNLFSEFADQRPTLKSGNWTSSTKNLFNTCPFLPVEDLNEDELAQWFGKEIRHVELEKGKLLSFFSRDNNHVVLRAKEVLVDRPHGNIMQAKAGLVPDESIVSTNSFAYGVFNSHLTQGNTNFNSLLSVCSSQFNTSIETGQRIFVRVDGEYHLLGVPSAFEMGLNHCRWIYKMGNRCFQVRTWTSKLAPQVNVDFKVLCGEDVDLLITHHFDAANGWRIITGNATGEYIAKPKVGSEIETHFPGAQFRIVVQSVHSNFTAHSDDVLYHNKQSQSDSLFVLAIKNTVDFCMSFIGDVCFTADAIKIKNADQQWLSDCSDARSAWRNLSLNLSFRSNHIDIAAIGEVLPWFGSNALTHYLTPYGLEQFSGAAWGTRDVSQGPIDLLLNLQKYEEAKQVLRIIFSNQHSNGGWPQWWMFDSYSHIRANDAHGDVVYWCIISLSNYITATGDLKILDEALPYFNEDNSASPEVMPLSEHVDRVIKLITNSFIKGTALVPFGGGDWNDSLQPVSEELAQRMISSWTVEMNFQAFMQYQKVCEFIGNTEKATFLKEICEDLKSDFNKYLIKDGVVAGYGLLQKDGSISVMLHPSDADTGIHYSLLPMNRGIISGIFSAEQAVHHQQLIEKHLKGPDGARLMDRPLRYSGGIQTIFQRAESSTFFGREIGLMYVHEHIRYAESLAITGRAYDFLRALRQAIPVGYRGIVPEGDIRQSNCYYSSSDVVFKNRYQADELYNNVISGKKPLRGGWRVYSSGPGIYIGLIISRLLGLRVESEYVIIDPVMPHSLNGFSAHLIFLGFSVRFVFIVKEKTFSPSVISINGKAIKFSLEENKYRKGGAIISKKILLTQFNQDENTVEVQL
jgi:1,2-beta-oligoglucan phosphorylase